jgi:hypothetical protein
MALLLLTRRQQLASRVAADIIINLFVPDKVCLVSATNALLSNSGAPAGCRRARRVQAGWQGAGRNKAVAHSMYSDTPVYTIMYPLNQDKKISCKSMYKHAHVLYLKISH